MHFPFGTLFICIAMFCGTAWSLRLGPERIRGPPKRLARKAKRLGHPPQRRDLSWTNLAAHLDNATAACGDPGTLGAFRMDPRWGKYPLGDLWLGRRDMFSYACGNSSFAGMWPESLYCEDMREFPKSWQSRTSLFQLVKRRIGNQTKNQGVVVHLRIGDAIDNSTSSVKDILEHQTCYSPHHIHCFKYAMPLEHYRDVVRHLSPGQLVTLVGSPHPPDNGTWTRPFIKSCVYTYAVAAYLQEIGHHVQVRVGHAPDDDVVFMANSKIFVPSGGGYSQMLCDMVRMNGGRVVKTSTLHVADKKLRNHCEYHGKRS